MEIWLTRHGQTRWNVLKKVQGKADIELNEIGIQQARETAEKLKNIKIDLIISSPLKRAKQTADIINEGRNIPIVIDDRISERDFGEFEGMATTDFDFNAFWSYKQNKKYDKAENIEEFFYRVFKFLNEVKDKYEDKSILIVSHGGISIPVKCYFDGIPDEETLLPLSLGNCEVVKFEFRS